MIFEKSIEWVSIHTTMDESLDYSARARWRYNSEGFDAEKI